MKETMQTQLKLSDLNRRQLRYICFRLQTEATGGVKALPEDTGPMLLVSEIKSNYEEQDDFGGWNNFAKTWDIDVKSPLVAVLRTSSIYTDWNKVLKAEAKELPTTPAATPTVVSNSILPKKSPKKKRK